MHHVTADSSAVFTADVDVIDLLFVLVIKIMCPERLVFPHYRCWIHR